MNKTCSNCKYWGCGLPVQSNKHNECEIISFDQHPSKDTAFIDVQVDDDSNLRVGFMTMANFGCSLHVSKIN